MEVGRRDQVGAYALEGARDLPVGEPVAARRREGQGEREEGGAPGQLALPRGA